ncbi:hypothetical protein NJT12_24130 [Flavobacterium sp. AC]|uniref:Lipoprotein n=1 Tax=Flavobacterium azizsancarii TaxID=2961580 RepID=A0ABT4WLG7_9FLAO|nr:hypothetical protein [Flavobacterium azizsancarii]MDA6072715.1 hypothetical protein [Flavobacterium azizsancarii]
MKIVASLSIALLLFSCNKKDTINHFLTKPITQQDLIKNGFYKYSYIATSDDHDNIDDTIKSVAKYDMYSNVKPEVNKEGKVCPTQLWNFDNEDSIKKRKNLDYFKNELESKMITYLFRNNTLFYKEIDVEFFDKSHNQIPGFESWKKIINYYNSLKIPIEPVVKNINTGELYTGLFMVDNYRTRFFFSEEEKYYGMFTNYLNNSTYCNILEYWYSGYVLEMY